jgi:hypothetical protein
MHTSTTMYILTIFEWLDMVVGSPSVWRDLEDGGAWLVDGHDDAPARLGQVTQRRHHRLRLLDHKRQDHVVRVMLDSPYMFSSASQVIMDLWMEC